MPDQPSLFDLPDVAPYARDGHATSRVSAYKVGPNAKSQCGQVVAYMAAQNRPVTAAEIADRFGRSRNQTAARLWDLRNHGYIEWCDTLAPTGAGHHGRLQQLTQRGRENIST